MNTAAFRDPGFWLHSLALIVGAVSTSGLVTDVSWVKGLGIALVVLNALGAGQAYSAPAPVGGSVTTLPGGKS